MIVEHTFSSDSSSLSREHLHLMFNSPNDCSITTLAMLCDLLKSLWVALPLCHIWHIGEYNISPFPVEVENELFHSTWASWILPVKPVLTCKNFPLASATPCKTMLWKLFQFIYSFGLFLEALTLQLLRVTRIQISLTISLLNHTLRLQEYRKWSPNKGAPDF